MDQRARVARASTSLGDTAARPRAGLRDHGAYFGEDTPGAGHHRWRGRRVRCRSGGLHGAKPPTSPSPHRRPGAARRGETRHPVGTDHGRAHRFEASPPRPGTPEDRVCVRRTRRTASQGAIPVPPLEPRIGPGGTRDPHRLLRPEGPGSARGRRLRQPRHGRGPGLGLGLRRLLRLREYPPKTATRG